MSNQPNSQNDVLTTMSHALLSFQELVQDEMPNIPVIYDEGLSFETALKQLLAMEGYMGSQDKNLMPFLAYKRTVLREVENRALGKRAKSTQACIKVGDDILRYDVTYGEFDIQFLYASNKIELTEKFEVVYNSEEGITGSKELVVEMAELGDFKYFLEYGELAEKLIEHEDTYYKGVVGSITARGFYFTFKGKSGLIKELRQRIIATHDIPNKVIGEILSDVTCVPTP